MSSAHVDSARYPSLPSFQRVQTNRLSRSDLKVNLGTFGLLVRARHLDGRKEERSGRESSGRSSQRRRKHRIPDRGKAGPPSVVPCLRVPSRSFDHSQEQEREDCIASTRASAPRRGEDEESGAVFKSRGVCCFRSDRTRPPVTSPFSCLHSLLQATTNHYSNAKETDRTLLSSFSTPTILRRPLCSPAAPPTLRRLPSSFSPPKEPLS